MGQNLQIELMFELHFKSLVFLSISHEIELEHQLKPIKVMQNRLFKTKINSCFGGPHQ